MRAVTLHRCFGVLATATTIAAYGCTSSTNASAPKIANLSNKDFTEQLVLSAIFQLTLESQGFQVNDLATPGLETAEIRLSLLNGDIDLYPEYTGTALTNFPGLKAADGGSLPKSLVGDPVQSWQYASSHDLALNDVVWSQPTRYNNTWAYALRRQFALQNNVTTLSQLVAYAVANPTKIQFLASNEFYARTNDGVLAMLAAYGAGSTLAACGTGTVPATGGACAVYVPDPTTNNSTVYPFFEQAVVAANAPVPGNPEYAVMAFGTDSQVAQYDLAVMQDDQEFWPYYACAVTARGAWADRHPEVVAALNDIMPRIDEATMQRLNALVDDQKLTPLAVAKAWLQSQGLQPGDAGTRLSTGSPDAGAPSSSSDAGPSDAGSE